MHRRIKDLDLNLFISVLTESECMNDVPNFPSVNDTCILMTFTFQLKSLSAAWICVFFKYLDSLTFCFYLFHLESGFLIRSLPSGSLFIPTWNLSSLLRLSQVLVLQVVTISFHLSKGCYPQLVLNPHPSQILPPK